MCDNVIMSKNLIAQLGGVEAVATALGQRRNVVWNWCDRDTVPWRWRPAIAALAKTKGFAVPDTFLIPEAA